jgi:hypothetical protein
MRGYAVRLLTLLTVLVSLTIGGNRATPALADDPTLRPTDGSLFGPLADGEWVVWRESEMPFGSTGDLRAGRLTGDGYR